MHNWMGFGKYYNRMENIGRKGIASTSFLGLVEKSSNIFEKTSIVN